MSYLIFKWWLGQLMCHFVDCCFENLFKIYQLFYFYQKRVKMYNRGAASHNFDLDISRSWPCKVRYWRFTQSVRKSSFSWPLPITFRRKSTGSKLDEKLLVIMSILTELIYTIYKLNALRRNYLERGVPPFAKRAAGGCNFFKTASDWIKKQYSITAVNFTAELACPLAAVLYRRPALELSMLLNFNRNDSDFWETRRVFCESLRFYVENNCVGSRNWSLLCRVAFGGWFVGLRSR